MRLTGQATTALGNFIINSIVHMKLVRKNSSIITTTLGLGDDFCMITECEPNFHYFHDQATKEYNMQLKFQSDAKYGTFCGYMVYVN